MTAHGRLGIGVIGMGKAGPVIGSALRAAGHSIVGVAAQSADAIERADAVLPGAPVLPIETLVERSEVVVLAVPDAEIEGLVAGLAELGAWRMGQIVIHLAGPYGSSILAPAQAAGAIGLAIHPVVRLTGWSVDVQRLVGAPFLVSAPAAFLPIAQALVVEMGGEPLVVEEDRRAALDAALASGLAGVVASIARSLETLSLAGVENPSLLAARLFTEGAELALDESERGLSAPFSSGDADAVRAHIRALARIDAGPGLVDPTAGGKSAAARETSAVAVYAARAREAVALLAERGRLSERDVDALRAALLDS